MATQLSSLRTQARNRADMLGSNFVSDSEFNQYISDSYAELYDLLVSKFEDYYVAGPLTFTVASGASSYTLPADFYKLKGVDRSSNGSSDWYSLRAFNFAQRNSRRSTNLHRSNYPDLSYKIFGNTLRFTPDDDAAGTYRLWYIPRYTALTLDTDTVDGVNGWEIYIVTDAAIKALQKEESDVSVLMQQKMMLIKRIEDMAANRDVGEPETVTDIRNQDRDFVSPFWG